MLDPQRTLNCGGRLLDLQQPRIMGILNLTPDSFYAGSRQQTLDQSLATAAQMLDEGADLLDLGAMSSRPGSQLISTTEEQDRLLPGLEAIAKAHPAAIISVDTVYAATAKAAVAAGARMINDISAGTIDPDLFSILPSLRVPYVLMHLRGTPATMQQQTDYQQLIPEMLDFLAQRLEILRKAGVRDVIIDPGFGFGKTVAQNYQILRQLGDFRLFDCPVLAGLSRKSMIWRPLGIDAERALNGSSALHMVALQQGAKILRVHDVAPAREVRELFLLLESEQSTN
ncbi:MAG: dihydropteroate synthase [Bacteroidota bacterium]